MAASKRSAPLFVWFTSSGIGHQLTRERISRRAVSPPRSLGQGRARHSVRADAEGFNHRSTRMDTDSFTAETRRYGPEPALLFVVAEDRLERVKVVALGEFLE